MSWFVIRVTDQENISLTIRSWINGNHFLWITSGSNSNIDLCL